MSQAIALYPTIDEQLTTKLGFEPGPFKFSYTTDVVQDMETQYLDVNSSVSLIKFEDPGYQWDPDNKNLIVRRTSYISNPAFLFGQYGVVPKDAELAVGVLWSSKSVNMRGAQKLTTFNAASASPVQIDLDLDFSPGNLKHELYLEMIVYISKPGNAGDNETHLGNQPGLILGTIDTTRIVLEGNGSVFPIVEVAEETMPLWWVVCAWTDILEDGFDEENVKICINTAHKNFDQVYSGKKIQDSPLFLEIMASSLQTIIHKAQESGSWQNVKSGDDLVPGSIGAAIHYFITTFGWDVSSPESLSFSIRQYLEDHM
ncbi:hypothetical protein N780_08580 [Pontibacillus chungwhensis BH030062]|uniref:Uncharacterized protein n=1 Tax=Pontibacillus chungwhensis BH030062 TaxID=1385513 RepID=A0A0A2VC62_9BACI|nr:hypothetical protein [Pontibacillus chungwhensis]KGP91255.1 hypothetical protein N780_08580 [Pontibacillus chungwhensis BH030062]